MSSVYPVPVASCLAMVIVGITNNWWCWVCIKLFQDAVFWALVTVWHVYMILCATENHEEWMCQIVWMNEVIFLIPSNQSVSCIFKIYFCIEKKQLWKNLLLNKIHVSKMATKTLAITHPAFCITFWMLNLNYALSLLMTTSRPDRYMPQLGMLFIFILLCFCFVF